MAHGFLSMAATRRGRLGFSVVLALWVVCDLGPVMVGAQGPSADVAADQTYAFVCADQSLYVVRIRRGDAWVFRPGSGLKLAPVVGSMPPRYAAHDVELIVDGQLGRLIEPGKPTFSCRNDPRRAVWEAAKLDGVDFRAVGNEPPWVLEIREQARMILTTGYAGTHIERPLPKPVTDAEKMTTRWDAGDLQVEATIAPCRDVMSGEAFESRVAVHWQGQTLRGCGRALH